MRPGDLTTLENVKQWLAIDTDVVGADALLVRMISAASLTILQFLQRESLAFRSISETRDGWGGTQIVLKNWPVLAITSVVVFGRDVPQAAGAGSAGYRLQDLEDANGGQQTLFFINTRLPNERQSVVVTYDAGYVRDEARTLPEAASGADTVPVQTYNLALVDLGVTGPDGEPMERIKTGDPAAGQYRYADGGLYTFAATQAGDDVVIRYSYVPSAIEDAVIQMIGTRYKGKDNIGVSSKTLGGQETVVFDKRDISPSMREMLQSYRRVV